MKTTIASHALFGCLTALLASAATYAALTWPGSIFPTAQAQTAAPAATGMRQTELFKTVMEDVLGRVASIRVTERDPGNGSGPHRHPGTYNFGYVLEGTYEVQINDGPLQRLGPGGVFFEAPGALHAVSRNGSQTQPVKYLLFSVTDPSKPATVQEP
jgi:quercetin dioxygenase-like cupin family protein